jgi:L-aspartate oxidase
VRGQDEPLDVLVVGSGIAGLSTAIALAGRRNVAVVAKEAGGGGSTELAQGGIAAAVGPGDSWAAHAADTVAAAAGLGDPGVAEAITSEAAEAVAMLAALGARFDSGALAREGGHSCARVVHARGDATGAEITHALMTAARRLDVPVVPGMLLVDLLTSPDRRRVEGALVWDSRERVLRRIHASNVVLATGGYGQLWASTTSPRACSGDGLAAALRAGAQAGDLELVQFHPTGMALGVDPRPLASEALRGAGARLRDSSGEYIHPAPPPPEGRSGPGEPAGDLAPRDIVSRSMARRMADLGADHCYLDATMLGLPVLEKRFPTFTAACRAGGLSPERECVPVSPTAHYTMGGVLTDAEGRTTLEGLMAVGEVGCSGLHGANRLASNSLLEGAVIGRGAARVVLESRGPVAPRDAVELGQPLVYPARPSGARALGRHELRSAMQADAGVARDAHGLERLAGYLTNYVAGDRPGSGHAGCRSGGDWPVTGGPVTGGPVTGGPVAPEEWEIANMALVARTVVSLAMRRCESRGAHWRTDYPAANPAWRVRQVLGLLPGGHLGVGTVDVELARRPVAGPAAVAR